jgi:hypothetical protein
MIVRISYQVWVGIEWGQNVDWEAGMIIEDGGDWLADQVSWRGSDMWLD